MLRVYSEIGEEILSCILLGSLNDIKAIILVIMS